MEVSDFIEDKILPEKPKKKHRPFFIIATILLVAVMATGTVAVARVNTLYKNRVYPGLHIGDLSLGGMHTSELEKFLRDMNDKLASSGAEFIIHTGTSSTLSEEKKFTLFPVVVSETNSRELMRIDEKKEAKRLVNYGKKDGLLSLVMFFIQKPEVQIESIVINEVEIVKILQEETVAYTKPPQNADINITSRRPLEIKTLPAEPGIQYDFRTVASDLVAAWSRLRIPRIRLTPESVGPIITETDLSAAIKNIDSVLSGGPLWLQYNSEEGKTWKITEDNLQKWIGVRQYEIGDIALGVKLEPVQKYLEAAVAPEVNVEPQDARFLIGENGQVQEFMGSRSGIEVDIEQTSQALSAVIRGRSENVSAVTSTVFLSIKTVEPQIKTGDANNLGITDVLGVGISNFKGSPANRIHNIKASVKKLNGILIKPGEEFSAIRYTQPYTLQAGYLPEKVIKGDKITPEIGGGLCQIGTTLFRMAMNSGMEITERRNHSLVVSYYNDPQNGLPGTDATIYEPAPDFRFKNDTAGHILIQTAVNVEKGELRFTLWGISDGRKGYYTKPVVSRWIPAGTPRMIETTSLKPGVKECQNAFRGADASFTYVRELSDGTSQKRVFESHYRPLPQICLVGVETPAPVCEGENCPAVTPSTPEPQPPAGLPLAEVPAPLATQ